MHYRDLRDWLDGVESFGELRIVEGAHWNQEIGAVAEVAAHTEPPPAVLFDKIIDYPPGRRVLTGVHNPTLKRQVPH
jgi:3-polyprenyl-4-hydroxybenzoate decarboxylase